MERAAEGMTGKKGVEFFLLPRKAFIYAPSSGAAIMFRSNRGFDIQKLNFAEKIAIRLASFASNTQTAGNLRSRIPTEEELSEAFRRESQTSMHEMLDEDALSKMILDLASHSEGIFYFINSSDRPEVFLSASEVDESASAGKGHDTPKGTQFPTYDRFFKIENELCDLFSRLATIEAMRAVDEFDRNRKALYPTWFIFLMLFLSSAGAAGFWFNGSWADVLAAGMCGVLVGVMRKWGILSREERVIFEVFVSIVVGTISGLISINWSDNTCYGAIALAGVLQIFQGYRMVYSVVEVLSKHSINGVANFLEAIMVSRFRENARKYYDDILTVLSISILLLYRFHYELVSRSQLG